MHRFQPYFHSKTPVQHNTYPYTVASPALFVWNSQQILYKCIVFTFLLHAQPLTFTILRVHFIGLSPILFCIFTQRYTFWVHKILLSSVFRTDAQTLWSLFHVLMMGLTWRVL